MNAIKQIILPLLLSVWVFTGKDTSAQLAQDSWAFGFGVKYPKFISSGLFPSEINYGLFVSGQCNFTKYVGFRLNANYLYLEGKIPDRGITQSVDMLALNYELLYYFIPYQSVSPYFVGGFGNTFSKFKKDISGIPGKWDLDYQMNMGFGTEWALDGEWKVITEVDYHTSNSGKIDGVYNAGNGLLGGNNDTYTSVHLGLQYYFLRNESSGLAGLYDGIASKAFEIDYDRIDAIVKKYQSHPAESIDYGKIEEIVKKSDGMGSSLYASSSNWVLVGVNFGPNSAKFDVESYPILYYAAQTLLQNPEMKVEIQGYSDDKGEDMANLNISLKRAKAVKDYLVVRGVKAERLTAVGFGSKNPVGDNNSISGRLLNRRIEFKVLK
ncbi:MAG: OmpA family protein [Ignavibacteria bacterium]